MMSRRRRGPSPLRFLIPAVAVGAAGVAVFVIARSQPDSTVGRYVAEAEGIARSLPDRARGLAQDARDRFALAKSAFHEARAQSQRALTSQLEEAKHRGSLPPI